MGHDWIIDVLTDLKNFARQNDLPVLAELLDDAALVAAAEIESIQDNVSPTKRGDSSGTRPVLKDVGTSRRT